MRQGAVETKGSWRARLIRVLVSVRVTEAFLLLLAVLCVAATVIPQTPYRPGDGLAIPVRAVMSVSLRDVFHSLWFLGASVFLAVSCVACMVFRFSARRTGAVSAVSGRVIPVAGSGTPPVVDSLRKILPPAYRIDARHDRDGLVAVCERGRIRRLAPYAIHGGVVLVVAGALLAFAGFKGTIALTEGGMKSAATLLGGTIMPLGFGVRSEGFSVERYPDGMPREYSAEVSFVKDGRRPVRRVLRVNHPVLVEGILFSLSGFDETHEAVIAVMGPRGARRFTVGEGSVVDVDGVLRVRVVRVEQDMMRMGPCVRLVPVGGDEEDDLWLFGRIERIESVHPGITRSVRRFDPSRYPGYTFVLEGIRPSYITVLGVNRDPGVWLVATGACLFLAGIGLGFLVVHERVTVRIDTAAPAIRTAVVSRTVNGSAVPVDDGLLRVLKEGGGGRS